MKKFNVNAVHCSEFEYLCYTYFNRLKDFHVVSRFYSSDDSYCNSFLCDLLVEIGVQLHTAYSFKVDNLISESERDYLVNKYNSLKHRVSRLMNCK